MNQQFPYTNQYPQYGQSYNQASVIPMHIPGQQQAQYQRKNPFQGLQNQFEYTPITQSNAQIDCAWVTLKSGNQIKIDVPVNNQIPPTVYYQNQLYSYQSFFQYRNNLLELVLKIQENLYISDNPLVKEIIQLKDSIQEDTEYNKIKQLPLNQLLSGVESNQYQEWLNKNSDELITQLCSIQEYSRLCQYLFALVQQNEILGETIENNEREMQQIRETILNKNNKFSEEKQTYLMLTSQCRSMSERFEKSKIVITLTRLQDFLDDKCDNLMEESLQNNDNMEEDLAKYYQLRKTYNRVNMILQVFKKNNDI